MDARKGDAIMKVVFRSLFTAALLLAMTSFAAAAGLDSHSAVKVGKSATVQILNTTMIGGLTLQPGTYSLNFKTENDQHYMDVVMTGKGTGAWAESSAYGRVATYVPVGEVKCRLEQTTGKNQQTALYTTSSGGMRSVTKLEVRGETVAHLF